MNKAIALALLLSLVASGQAARPVSDDRRNKIAHVAR